MVMYLIPCLWLCFAWIYVLICFLPCFMLRSAYVHAYMLGFMFFHVYLLALTCSTCIAMPMPRSIYFQAVACSDLGFHMLICLDLCSYMLVCLDLCTTCFMPSSMCLCAPCHVCVLRPRLCLSCHVLLYPFCRFNFLSCVLAMWLGPDLDPVVFIFRASLSNSSFCYAQRP